MYNNANRSFTSAEIVNYGGVVELTDDFFAESGYTLDNLYTYYGSSFTSSFTIASNLNIVNKKLIITPGNEGDGGSIYYQPGSDETYLIRYKLKYIENKYIVNYFIWNSTIEQNSEDPIGYVSIASLAENYGFIISNGDRKSVV